MFSIINIISIICSVLFSYKFIPKNGWILIALGIFTFVFPVVIGMNYENYGGIGDLPVVIAYIAGIFAIGKGIEITRKK